ILTDPVIHSDKPGTFGVMDHGNEGKVNFFATHKCNSLCSELRLPQAPTFVPTSGTIEALTNVKIKLCEGNCGNTLDSSDENKYCSECCKKLGEKITAICKVCSKSFEYSPFFYKTK